MCATASEEVECASLTLKGLTNAREDEDGKGDVVVVLFFLDFRLAYYITFSNATYLLPLLYAQSDRLSNSSRRSITVVK